MGSQYRLLRILCLLLVGATLLEAYYYEKEPICAYQGARFLPSYASYNQSGLLSVNQCGALCLASVKCTSFSLSLKTCRLYDQYVYHVFFSLVGMCISFSAYTSYLLMLL